MGERKRVPLFVKIAILVFVLILAAFAFVFYREYTRPTTQGETIEVEIKEGASTKEVVSLLRKKGVIHLQTPFYVKMYRAKSRGKLRYGVYQLSSGMSLNDLLKTLMAGGEENKQNVLVIPEGFSVERIAERLEQNGVMKADEFKEAVKKKAKDWTYTKELPEEEEVFYQLEGYLFPDTYHLEEGMTPDQLVDMILHEFETKFDKDRIKLAKEAGMSVEEVLIRASLLQKEADLVPDYAMVAGVINNRLEKKMRLQFDSTVVYAMTEGEYGVDRVLYSYLEVDSPYNTYKVSGLPVGPICNPGMDAIDAVLHPVKHDYLFFQTDCQKNDGSNLYFETYEEHAAAAATSTVDKETETATEEESATKEK